MVTASVRAASVEAPGPMWKAAVAGVGGAQNCTGADKRDMRPTRREQDAPRPTPEEHARVKRELEESEREPERLQRRIERLEKQNARLKRELDAARRAGYRQAAPFAKTVTREPKRPGRRAGAQYGQPTRRCRPNRVDVRHDVPLPPSCPDCAGRVHSTGMATQFQEELPVPRVLVREFRVALGACQDCGQRVRVGIGCRPPTPSAPPEYSWAPHWWRGPSSSTSR